MGAPAPSEEPATITWTAVTGDYFHAIENDPDLPKVTWIVGERGQDVGTVEVDAADPFDLSSGDEDVQEALAVVRDSI